MIQCPVCRTDNQDHERLCSRCGYDLTKEAWVSGESASAQADQPQATRAMGPPPDSASAKAPPPRPAARPKPSVSLREHPDFPKAIPSSLWESGGSRQRLYAFFGLVLGVGISVLVSFVASPESMLGRMFDLHRVETAIPITISWLFFWALFICNLRRARLRLLERFSSGKLLQQATEVLRSEGGLAALAEDLKDPVCQASPLLRRLRAVVQQWGVHASLQDADIVLQQHVASDEEAVHAGYSLVRTFVWALPVLGLIGTVLGISHAVGGFAQFLGGNIDKVAEIKKNLVGVTGGLSFAFLITLQGLLTSLLAMLAASSLQTREEKLYAATQQAIVDTFLPALQEITAEAPARGGEELETWRKTLQQVAVGILATFRTTATGILTTFDTTATKLLEGMDAQGQAQLQQMTDWKRSWLADVESGATLLREALDTASGKLERTGSDFFTRLEKAGEMFVQEQAVVVAQRQAAAQQHSEMMVAMAKQMEVLQTSASALVTLSDTTKTVLQQQASLQDSLRQLHDANVERTFTSYVEALSGQARGVQAVTDAVSRLTAETHTVLSSQATLQEAMRQIHNSGLDQTLVRVGDSLKGIGPILESFRQPFVLRAVPADGNMREDGR